LAHLSRDNLKWGESLRDTITERCQQTSKHRYDEQRYPSVSLIIPTFNRVEFLEKTINSLVDQDYPSERYEIIIVDNNSHDATLSRAREICINYDGQKNIKYIREERQGLVYARHTGAAHAEGEILFFGDDDAIYERNLISEIVSVYMQHPNVGAVGTKILIKWDKEPLPWVHRHEPLMGKLDYGKEVITKVGLFINGGSFSIKKKVLFAVEGFNVGQKGEYLLGDCETGLCRKLAKQNVLVGWTPNTVMWHVQIVDKNGTLADIQRRCYNNGIAEAYRITYHNGGYVEQLKNFVNQTAQWGASFILFVINFKDRNFYRNTILSQAYYRGYIRYIAEYRINRELREELSYEDWKLNSTYAASPVLLMSQSYTTSEKIIE